MAKVLGRARAIEELSRFPSRHQLWSGANLRVWGSMMHSLHCAMCCSFPRDTPLAWVEWARGMNSVGGEPGKGWASSAGWPHASGGCVLGEGAGAASPGVSGSMGPGAARPLAEMRSLADGVLSGRFDVLPYCRRLHPDARHTSHTTSSHDSSPASFLSPCAIDSIFTALAEPSTITFSPHAASYPCDACCQSWQIGHSVG